MNTGVAEFLAEIRASPRYIAGASADPVYISHLEAMEKGLEFAYSSSVLDGAMIEIFDEIACVANDKDRPLKARLLEIGRLMIKARDLGKAVQ